MKPVSQNREDAGTPEEGTPEEDTKDTPKEGAHPKKVKRYPKKHLRRRIGTTHREGAGVVEKLHKAGLDKFKDEDAFIKVILRWKKMNSKKKEKRLKKLKQENEELKQTINEILSD